MPIQIAAVHFSTTGKIAGRYCFRGAFLLVFPQGGLLR
jgi:hypothetical protein